MFDSSKLGNILCAFLLRRQCFFILLLLFFMRYIVSMFPLHILLLLYVFMLIHPLLFRIAKVALLSAFLRLLKNSTSCLGKEELTLWHKVCCGVIFFHYCAFHLPNHVADKKSHETGVVGVAPGVSSHTMTSFIPSTLNIIHKNTIVWLTQKCKRKEKNNSSYLATLMMRKLVRYWLESHLHFQAIDCYALGGVASRYRSSSYP